MRPIAIGNHPDLRVQPVSWLAFVARYGSCNWRAKLMQLVVSASYGRADIWRITKNFLDWVIFHVTYITIGGATCPELSATIVALRTQLRIL